jgi:chromosome segregation ATPase
MGFLDSLKSWLRSEAADLTDAKGELETRLDRDLSERERRLNETPAEAMERLQQEIEQNQGSFDAIEDRLAHGQAKANAHADFAEAESESSIPIDDAADDDSAES